MQFSQYYANSLYLNPAFTGAIPHSRVAVNYRLQWPELPVAFSNYSISYDFNASNLNSGFGVLVNADRAGSANLRNTSAALNYSYTVQWEDKFVIKPGISFGYVNRTLDFNGLIFGDQIDFGIGGAPTQDPVASEIRNINFLEFGSGILLYNKSFWAGFSAFHINEPNNSLLSGTSTLPMKLSLHAGFRKKLGDSRFNTKRASISPSFIYKIQGEFHQLDLGANIHYEPIILGLFYRGIPIVEIENNQINHDALILVFGFELDRFRFGYSYDFTISNLGSSAGGAHEFSLVYQFKINSKKSLRANDRKYLQCPAFIEFKKE